MHRKNHLCVGGMQQRIRDVGQGPDGYLSLLTAENDGALLRLEAGTK